MVIPLHLLDKLEYMRAARRGQPLPNIEPGPALRALIERIEVQFGVRVLARPHTFGRGNAGSVRLDKGVITLFVHPDWPEEEARRIGYHEAGHLLLREDGTDEQLDCATIPGYHACERAADERAYALAEEWGDGGLFDAETRTRAVRNLDEMEEACEALAYSVRRTCCDIRQWERLAWVLQHVNWLWQYTAGSADEDVIEAALVGSGAER
jgi:hypothetical protein